MFINNITPYQNNEDNKDDNENVKSNKILINNTTPMDNQNNEDNILFQKPSLPSNQDINNNKDDEKIYTNKGDEEDQRTFSNENDNKFYTNDGNNNFDNYNNFKAKEKNDIKNRDKNNTIGNDEFEGSAPPPIMALNK